MISTKSGTKGKETVLSLMADPDSVLYTEDLGGRNNSRVYNGIVCNGLVRYAMQIRGGAEYVTPCTLKGKYRSAF